MKAEKMLGKAVLIFVLLGTVNSDPIRRSVIVLDDLIPSHYANLLSDYAERIEFSLGPETMKSVKNLINNAIGLKLSALEIGVKFVQWLISNFVGIAIGGILAIGICKITGKCEKSFDHIFSKIYSFIPSDDLDTAQNLLLSAVRRFGQDEKEEEEKQENEDEKKNE